jgi:hypothetical protein
MFRQEQGLHPIRRSPCRCISSAGRFAPSFQLNVIAPIEQHHDWYGRIRPKPNSVDMSADIKLLPEGPCPWEKKG